MAEDPPLPAGRLRGAADIGGRLTEFGEKQADGRAELRVRFFF